MKNTLIDLYLLGGAAALAGILALLAMAISWGAKKIKWERVRNTVMAAWEILDPVIREANAELQLQLKAARAEDSDGGVEVTDAEWKAARKAAVAKFKKLYGLENLAALAAALGLSLGGLDEWIGGAVGGGLDPK